MKQKKLIKSVLFAFREEKLLTFDIFIKFLNFDFHELKLQKIQTKKSSYGIRTLFSDATGLHPLYIL